MMSPPTHRHISTISHQSLGGRVDLRIVDLCQRDLVSGMGQLARRAKRIADEVVCARRKPLLRSQTLFYHEL